MSATQVDAAVKTHYVKKYMNCCVRQYCTILLTGIPRILTDVSKKNEYTCSTCNYKCHKLQDLQIHLHVHAGEKHFRCSVCLFRTSCKSYLRFHVKYVHLNISPFVCKICFGKFLSKAGLDRHMIKHGGTPEIFRCRNCSFAGKTQNCLIKHYKMCHNTQSSYKCDKCNYETVFSFNLTKHKYVHENRKLFICLGCYKQYKCFESLKKHVKKHHAT